MKSLVERDVQTLIQLSTPYAVSAIHIIRLTGDGSLAFLKKHTRLGNSGNDIIANKVYHTNFFNKEDIIDAVMCFFCKKPRSYTGEDVVEIHCHGSLLVVNEILQQGVKDGLLLAERGEFTKRAVLNGKIRLNEAEAINTLIHANSNSLKKKALEFIERKSNLNFSSIKEELLEMLAYLESAIEFPEEDISEIDFDKEKLYNNYKKRLANLKTYFCRILDNYDKGQKAEQGIAVMVLGKPNAGKSSLMNYLLRDERVLVSDIKGTTRDFVRERIFIDGFPVWIYDTAGLRETKNRLEKSGINKTLSIVPQADIVIYLLISKSCIPHFLSYRQQFSEVTFLCYLNKADLLSEKDVQEATDALAQADVVLNGVFSLKRAFEEALSMIESDLKVLFAKNYRVTQNEIVLLNERHKVLAKKIVKKLTAISELLVNFESEEIITGELESLNGYLNEFNLDFDNEGVFDKIFQSFCLGK